MDVAAQRITEKFAAFEQTHDAARVIEALEIVEAATRDLPAGDVAARRAVVSNWFSFLALLDRSLDPTFDPRNVPVKGVAPPPGHGVVHPSGEVDPESIPDPSARAEYIRALDANTEARRRYQVQAQLRRVEADAVRFLELLLAGRYSGSGQDTQELEELLAASPLAEARRDRIRAAINRPR
jgi:hypothetical protein